MGNFLLFLSDPNTYILFKEKVMEKGKASRTRQFSTKEITSYYLVFHSYIIFLSILFNENKLYFLDVRLLVGSSVVA